MSNETELKLINKCSPDFGVGFILFIPQDILSNYSNKAHEKLPDIDSRDSK